jgi:deoxycytidylate deaminase
MSEFTALDAEQAVCKATIADENGRVIATGHAHEERGSSNINKTSYVENCETSAVGRALALLGIGIDTSIASANEVQDAIAKQDSTQEAAPVENIMDKAVNYVKSSTDKQKAFDSIISKYGEQLTDKQKAGLKKFVR